MKYLWQLIFNVITLLSLLLCVCSAVMWGRSRHQLDPFTYDRVDLRRTSLKIDVRSENGWLKVIVETVAILDAGRSRNWSRQFPFFEEAGWHYDRFLKAARTPLPNDGGIPGYIRREGGFYFLRFAYLRHDANVQHNPNLPPPEPLTRDITRSIFLPYYGITLLLTALPLARAAAWKRRRQERLRGLRGCCMKCGYDLRASPDRCPECGSVPKPSPPPSAPAALSATSP